MSDSLGHVCIFCLSNEASSKRYVIPSELGGGLKLKNTCKSCALTMSKIDTALVDSQVLKRKATENDGVQELNEPHSEDILRACAKISYSILAYVFGDLAVQSSHFDGLRQYILTGSVSPGPSALENCRSPKQKHVLNSKFVAWMPSYYDGNNIKLARPGTHLVYMLPMFKRHWIIIEFFGEQVFVIDLGEPSFSLGLPIFYEFNIQERSFRDVRVEELSVFDLKLRNA